MPALRAHRHVLLADALVLDRHLPARERHEPRAGLLVAIEQGRAAEGVGGGRQPPAGYPLSGHRRGLRRAPALVHGYGQAQPSREGEIRRMLGAQYAADAIGLEDELDVRGDGFGW